MTAAGRRGGRATAGRPGRTATGRRGPKQILATQLAQLAHLLERLRSLARLVRLLQVTRQLYLAVPKLMMIHHAAGALR